LLICTFQNDDVFYKKIKANVTPEVLAQLHSKKIILESTNQQQTKGRYSIEKTPASLSI
jgi:hypothetical protein